ncbi:hypothetical protein FOCG_07511 [Fusarium oxysporum f. sp. radicis-lycopersici 26381]|nr:hypothetical protein FOCG_07511 [Fusarium oxysporum f. sp. radicis-lycopersici 26381]
MTDFLDYLASTGLDNVLRDASRCCSNASQVSVLEVRGQVTFTSLPGLNQAQLERYFHPPNKDENQKSSEAMVTPCTLRVFFISATNSENGLHVHVDPAIMQLLHEKAGLTSRFLVDFYESHDWTVFPTSSVTNPNHLAIALQYGFWIWRTNSTHSFAQLVTDSKTATYFCINFPHSLQDHITNMVKSCPSLACKPLFIDTLILDDVIASYRAAIADQRVSLLDIEKDVDKSTIADRTRKLHALAVKWHTILKDLTDIQQHIQHLKSLSFRISPQPHVSTPNSQLHPSSLDEALHIMESSCLFWFRWVTAYLERTNIRINLMHNLAAQRVSSETTDIALQTQRDGVSMFTLAMVTAAFLPGTFVCSVLSTVFFNFDGTVFGISQWWWILPTVAVPLTGLVMYLWFVSFRTKLSRDKAALERARGRN